MCVGVWCLRTIHASVLTYVFCAWYVTCVVERMQAPAPNVGARIKMARDEMGLTQEGLATSLGQGERTVQAWERNERTPRLDTLTRLAHLSGHPVAWFYTDHEAEPTGAAA